MEMNETLHLNKPALDPFSRLEGDGYYEMEAVIAARAKSLRRHDSTPLFHTDAEGLYQLYLDALPEEARGFYTCSACRSFVEQYGDLVTVHETTGRLTSVLWDENDPAIKGFFRHAVGALRRAVESARITGVFLASQAVLGRARTGIWPHLHLDLPRGMVVSLRDKTAEQQMAEKAEDHRILVQALQKYSYKTINIAIEQVLRHQDAYRADRVMGQAEQFRTAAHIWQTTSGQVRSNLIWRIIGCTYPGTLHISSSPVGEVMDNLMAGCSVQQCRQKFSARMQTYQVSQAAPSAAEAAAAERKLEQLGLIDALQRRYAARSELPAEAFVWQYKAEQPIAAGHSIRPTGVFAGLMTKERQAAAAAESAGDENAEVMSWARFVRTVLPDVIRVEAKTENPQRLMALTTAAVPEAECILRYGNPFGWYYNGGSIDVRMKESIEAAGGRYENVQIRHSLMWENETPNGFHGTDLDNHCITPMGRHIFYGCRRDGSGELDVDANAAGSRTMTVPVENIRWVQGAANGRYRFYVHNFCQMDSRPNRYKAELAVGGQIWSYESVAGDTGVRQDTFEFVYENGTVRSLKIGGKAVSLTAGFHEWGLQANTFVPVTAIVTSPNRWGNKAVESIGNHTFFLLEGCRDTGEGHGRGFIAETLLPELIPLRRTLNAYTSETFIEGGCTADACGLGFSEEGSWNLTLRTTNRRGETRFYRIDRFD